MIFFKKEEDFSFLRKKMVEEQIKKRGIKDERVLSTMLKISRELFVPQELKKFAYEDCPLEIGYGQTISQPYIVALMTELLNLKNKEKVLEIGTGSGYQTAVLASLAKEVYSLEIIEFFAKKASDLLSYLGFKNVKIKCANGYLGWQEESPFDAIIVTCAPKEIPPLLVNQLKIEGKMVIPVGDIFQELKLIEKKEDKLLVKNILPVKFVQMIDG